MGIAFYTCAWILFHSCLASRNEAPKISNFYFPSRVLVGDQISALCFAVSSGSPKVFSWLKDGKDISTAPNVVIKMDKVFSVIIINPVSFSSSGNYTCVAENDYGISLYTAQLNVVSPPKWIKKPLDVTATVGKDVILECAAEGLPTPKLKWERIYENFTRHIVSLKSGISTLILKAAGMEDMGEYECSAGNEVSSISSRIKIKVIESPKIRKFRFDENIREGEVASVTCLATSAVKPVTFKWQKNGKLILENDGSARIDHGAIHSVLVFDSVKLSDDGNYTCIAENPAGTDSFTAELKVNAPPKWDEEPGSVVTTVRVSVSVKCMASGSPKPKISWRKRNNKDEFENIKWNDEKAVELLSGVLKLSSVSEADAGWYECIAENGISPSLKSNFSIVIRGMI